MSKKIHRAPLALATDGTVILNMAMLDVPKRVEKLIEAALAERGAIFIGVVLNRAELECLQDIVDDNALQAAFHLAGRRQATRRDRG